MQSAKRRWIYGGIGIADGVGLVSREPSGYVGVATPIARTRRIGIVGDELCYGLAPPLGQLAREEGLAFESTWRPNAGAPDWLERGWFGDALRLRPSLVLLAFGMRDDPAGWYMPLAVVRALAMAAERAGAALAWLVPPGATEGAVMSMRGEVYGGPHRVVESRGIRVPTGPDGVRPTAIGYAGWAGSVWGNIFRGARR